jgi:hypothetical protein
MLLFDYTLAFNNTWSDFTHRNSYFIHFLHLLVKKMFLGFYLSSQTMTGYSGTLRQNSLGQFSTLSRSPQMLVEPATDLKPPCKRP